MRKLVALLMLVALVFSQSLMVASANVDPPPDDPPSSTGAIKVHKFHDRNRNGVQDSGEEDLEGWLIRIYRLDSTGLYLVAEANTDENGNAIFDNLVAPTRYKVWEQAVECWVPTMSGYVGNWSHDQIPGYYQLAWTVADQTVFVEFGNVYECAPANPGTGTPGYWMNHPDAWPVSTITVGGKAYTKDEAIAMLKAPVKGNKVMTMFPALVAAQLNILIGNDDSCIADTVANSNVWMAMYGSEKVKANSDAWKQGEPMYQMLDAYNNGLLCAPARD